MATTTYTYAQLEQLWINNGGSSATAPVAAAVAMASQPGQAVVTSSNPDGGTNVGLWQLDTPGGGGSGYTVTQLQDPNTNAKAAVQALAGGANWSTWATYVSGAYKSFLSGSTTPDPNVPASSGGAPSQATLDAATQSAATCLIGFTSPSVLGIGGGTVCILSKQQMRNIIGSALIVSGGVLVLAGAVLVVGIGLGQSRVRALAGPVGGLAAGIGRQASGEPTPPVSAARPSRPAGAPQPARGRHARPGA